MKPISIRASFLVMAGILIIATLGTARSETTPEAYLAQAPVIPYNCCGLSPEDKDAFLDKVMALIAKMDEDISQRRNEAESNAERQQEETKKHYLNLAGISEKEAQRLEQASEAEQMAMANKILQKQYNMSMEEINKLKGAKEEDQSTLAQTYANRMMAGQQTDAQSSQARQLTAKPMSQLAQERTSLVERLYAGANKIGAEFAEIENDPAAKDMLENEIRPLEAKVFSLIGAASKSEAKELDRLTAELKAKKRSYCERFYPRYRAAFEGYLKHIKTSLPDCYRLEELQSELFKQQTGNDRVLAAPGLAGMEIVRDYVMRLQDIFKYDLR